MILINLWRDLFIDFFYKGIVLLQPKKSLNLAWKCTEYYRKFIP